MNTLTPALVEDDAVADLTRALRYASAEAADGNSYRDALNGALWSLTWEPDALAYPGRIAALAVGLVEKVLAGTGRALDAVDGMPPHEWAGVFQRCAEMTGAAEC